MTEVLGNRYEVGQLIGQGGMAQVYRARDRVLDRPVAIKILRAEYTGDTSLVARFQREAQAAANLVHPGIVAIYDVGQDGQQYYIVMEYITGLTLKEVIRQRAPLSVEFTLKVAEQVCSALEYAHRHGVIHRDIKPQNILLSEDEEVVKVADFGIAKSTLDPDTTAERLALGTVKYISPEQARGVQVVPQSDLYSLGVVLYEMLTAVQPFDGETPVSIARQHAEIRPRPPRQINPYIPPAIEGIVLRALAKDPNERFASAREMRMALERYRLAGAEVTGPIPQPLPAATGEPLRASRPAGPVPVESTTPPSYAPRRRAAAPASRSGLGPVGILLLLLIAAGIVGIVVMATQNWGKVFPATPTAAPTVTTIPTRPPPVVVRDLKGLTREEACSRLQQDGLKCTEGPPRFDAYVLPGQVAAQEPTYGVLVDAGSTVTLTLGAAPTLAEIPSVTLMTFAGAQLLLQQAGFRVQQAEVGCVATAAGLVDSQDPPPGRMDIQGITVTVFVSVGSNQSVLPEVLRVPLEDARRIIAEAGLVLRWEQPQTQADMRPGVDIDSLGAPGQVISYIISFGGRSYSSGEIRAGDKVPCGATIDLGYYATSP